MTFAQTVLLITGFALLATALVDVFVSLTRSSARSGYLTSFAEQVVCHVLMASFRWSGRRGFLAAAGPAGLISRTAIIVVAMITGYVLITLASPHGIVQSKTGQAADLAETIYFVGYSVATLGLGDFVPDTDVARLFTVLMALSGFLVITFVVGTISPLSDVVVAKNKVAFATLAAGSLAYLQGTESGSGERRFDALLPTILSDLLTLAEATHCLPVAHRFHAGRPEFALSVAFARINILIGDKAADRVKYGLALSSIDSVLTMLAETWFPTRNFIGEVGTAKWRDGVIAELPKADGFGDDDVHFNRRRNHVFLGA